MKSSKRLKAPKQYEQGWAEFYKLRFKVSPDVLIPRPETELLVDEVLNFAKDHPDLTVLDLGTGSGNIAISLSVNNPNLKIIASEVSGKALDLAKLNSQFHSVEKEIKFVVSDLLSDIKEEPELIVTNLPYIPTERISYLDSSVKDFEPLIALDGGEDGFELYRKLFAQIKEKGWKPKLVVGEIDYTHGELAIQEADKFFPNAQIEVRTDLAKKQRVLIILQEDSPK